MTCKPTYLIFSFLFSIISIYPAAAAQLCGKLAQGEILVGMAPEAETISFRDKTVALTPQKTFLIAFGRDELPGQTLIINGKERPLTVAPAKWDIQKLTGVPPRKVTPSEADLAAIEHESKSVRGAMAGETPVPYWQAGFMRPVSGRISGNFGGQRVMNGIKKNPHGGMDIAAPVGTPVAAASDGRIVLAEPDLFYSGNVIIIDHGYSLFTIYAHLSEIGVVKGQTVKKGEIIGKVGKTGRVTGPHLHWGASLAGTRFNPQSLLNISTSDDFCFNL